MNYLALVQRLKSESGRSGSGPATIASAVGDDRRMCNWIATAWDDVQRMHFDWAWMRGQVLGSTVIGVLNYTGVGLGASAAPKRWVPETNDYTVRVGTAGVQEWRLKYLAYDTFARQFLAGAHAPGAPVWWSVSPTKELLLGPAPDAVYSVRADYTRASTALAVDADEPNMPADFHMLLVWRALKRLAAFSAAPEIYAGAQEQHDEIEDALIRDQSPRITIESLPLA